MNRVRMGYYPTDLEHVQMIRKAVIFPESAVNILDPCCGEGLALETLADGEKAVTYGVELDEIRAEEAQNHLKRIGFGSFFHSRISSGAFQCVFLNPPYLSVVSESGHRRQEKAFLADSMRLLMDGGLLIYIIPYYRATPDICLALLDVMLPDIDGFEVCRRIRATGSKMGIIMLTAKSQEIDKVTGLMTGADDYVTKPFSPAELTARVDALIRRLGVDEEEKNSVEIVSGPFVLNVRNRTLEKNGQRLKLTQIEYLLMKLFMENPGKAMSREDILSAVWGSEFGGELKTVDVNIRRLRIKIESDPTEPEYLTTVWGDGYKWGY